MPQTGHRCTLWLASASDFVTLTEINVQRRHSTSRQSNRIDASHKQSDNKVFLPGVPEQTIDLECAFDIAAVDGDPTVLIGALATIKAAFLNQDTVYLEERVAPTTATVLDATNRFERFAGRLVQYTEDFPDEEVATISMQFAIDSNPAL